MVKKMVPAVIMNKEENAALAAKAKTDGPFGLLVSKGPNGKDGKPTWVYKVGDNSIPAPYTNFSVKNAGAGDCVQMEKTAEGMWTLVDCKKTAAYICENKRTKVEEKKVDSGSGTKVEVKGKDTKLIVEYVIHKGAKTIADGVKDCASKKMVPALINSKEENAALAAKA